MHKVAFLALLSIAFEASAQNAGQIKLINCLVSLPEGRELEVPALVAGQLISLEAKEGLDVEVGTVLGRIDDKQAQANREERNDEMAVSKEQAENDVNVQFATASLRVAETELKQNQEANRRVPGSVTQTELLRMALNVEKSRLQIKVAEMEMRIAGLTMGAKQARLKEIQGVIDRSEIKAPISGTIVELAKHRGEWCEPGAIVLKMVPMDLLRVVGSLNATKFNPSEVSNRPVTVQVQLARNVVENFKGKIVFVDPRVQAEGQYRVYAEVENRKNRDGTDLLRPGSDAEMTIDLRAGLAQDTLPPAGQSASPTTPVRR